MDLISMPKLNSLVTKLRHDYPAVQFVLAQRDLFRPPQTIHYTAQTTPLILLHELGHYLVGRDDFHSDVELLQLESLAWERAKRLCPKYHIAWDEDYAQDHLDSYRNYLYAASLCPNCNITGHQDDHGNYHCPLCFRSWPSPGRPDY